MGIYIEEFGSLNSAMGAFVMFFVHLCEVRDGNWGGRVLVVGDLVRQLVELIKAHVGGG